MKRKSAKSLTALAVLLLSGHVMVGFCGESDEKAKLDAFFDNSRTSDDSVVVNVGEMSEMDELKALGKVGMSKSQTGKMDKPKTPQSKDIPVPAINASNALQERLLHPETLPRVEKVEKRNNREDFWLPVLSIILVAAAFVSFQLIGTVSFPLVMGGFGITALVVAAIGALI